MLLFTLSQKSVTRALQRASWATQQQFLQLHPTIYIVTLYTPGYLEISWDVFAKKSADTLSFRISFTTISRENAFLPPLPHPPVFAGPDNNKYRRQLCFEVINYVTLIATNYSVWVHSSEFKNQFRKRMKVAEKFSTVQSLLNCLYFRL